MGNSLKVFIFLLVFMDVAWSQSTCPTLFSGQHISRASSFEEKSIRERRSFTVVTWNLNRFFVERPDRNLPLRSQKLPDNVYGIHSKSPSEIRRYQRVIDEISPDVLVLQEVVGSYTTRALDPHGKYYHEARTSVDPGGIQTVFMIRKSLNVSYKVRSPKAESEIGTPRGLPILSLRAKDASGKVMDPNQPDIMIMGLHLKSRNGMKEGLYNKVKEQEIEAILKAEKEMMKLFPETPFMIAGDMNVPVRSGSMLNPLKKKMQEALALAKPEATREDRSSHVSFLRDGTRVVQQLDAEFLNPALQKRLVDAFIYRYLDSNGQIRTYHQEGNVNYLPTSREAREKQESDHYPLVGVFDMRR